MNIKKDIGTCTWCSSQNGMLTSPQIRIRSDAACCNPDGNSSRRSVFQSIQLILTFSWLLIRWAAFQGDEHSVCGSSQCCFFPGTPRQNALPQVHLQLHYLEVSYNGGITQIINFYRILYKHLGVSILGNVHLLWPEIWRPNLVRVTPNASHVLRHLRLDQEVIYDQFLPLAAII